MELVVRPLADAFVEVGVFVGLMLGLFACLRRRYGSAVIGWLGGGSRLGPLVGALLGVVPGCGGAIVVMPMYMRGSVSFGTVVAALVATMGDSSFVLIAADPAFALTVHGLLFACGVASGVLVDLLRISPPCRAKPGLFGAGEETGAVPAGERPPGAVTALWLLLGAGLVLGVPAFLGFTETPVLPTPFGAVDVPLVIGLAGVAAAVTVLLTSRASRPGDATALPAPHAPVAVAAPVTVAAPISVAAPVAACAPVAVAAPVAACAPVRSRPAGLLAATGRETAFVTVLVAVASLVTSLAVGTTGLDVAGVLGIAGVGGVLAGAVVGLVPGCAPQIVLTGLYVSGGVPAPTLLANAASQDGDALFPLIAMARRPALVAAGLTTLPGLAVGGAWLLLA